MMTSRTQARAAHSPFHAAAVAWLLLALIACAIAATSAFAQESDDDAPLPDGLVRMGDVQRGVLLLRSTEPGYFLEAPTVATDVVFDVTGPVVRARVTQRFENPTDQWVEGVYAFPLPEDAGVDTLKMLIGDRMIEGLIKEREEARQIYEEARAEGRKAALVEQERPNLFTNSVANIGPGETVVVQIEYQNTARLLDGRYELRLPLTSGPRYLPDQRPDGTDPVPNRDGVTFPVANPADEPEDLRLPVTIRATLRAGYPLGEIESPYHDVDVRRPRPEQVTVTLADGPIAANRDFVLAWAPEEVDQPIAALFAEEREDATYVLAVVTPPKRLGDATPRRDREAIFVIDNSGSMSGPSMVQAKAALELALDRLQPTDTFNVIRFDDTMELVFDDAVPASQDNLTIAKTFVRSLEAEGGTEMLPALQAALVDAAPDDDSRVRQVIFLTDGAIGNETELFTAIDDGLGRSRLFTVGIGSAPNSFFMNRAARIGRGTFTFIGDLNEVADQMAQLFEALERPIMTNLEADFTAAQGRIVAYPDPLPDLYAGEPVQLVARVDSLDGDLAIAGDLGTGGWTADLPLDDAIRGPGIANLWARARITDIEEGRFRGVGYEDIDRAVLRTALDFSLVSRLTSLVAVDVTPSRPASEELETRPIASMLPDGWDFAAVFGEDVAPVDIEAFRDVPAFDVIDARATQDAPTLAQTRGLTLPMGSTVWAFALTVGLGLTLLGALALLGGRAPARVRAKRRR